MMGGMATLVRRTTPAGNGACPALTTTTELPNHNVGILGCERAEVSGAKLLNVFLWASSSELLDVTPVPCRPVHPTRRPRF